MQTILVPCDFSGPAVQGLHFAVELAAAHAGNVIVLSVISTEQERNEPFIFKRLRKNFEDIAAEIVHPIRIRQEILSGKLVPVTKALIAEKAVDVVVIGTRGSRGWEGTFMGSNVEKIVRTSTVPVFAVRQETHLGRIKNIVFPCDLVLSDHYGLAQLKKIQAEFGAKLHLLRVDTSGLRDQHYLADRLREYASFHGLSNYTTHVATESDEKEGILRFAKETGADMIAMTTHGAADLNHLYMSSIAADVVNHAHLLTWTCIQQPRKEPVT